MSVWSSLEGTITIPVGAFCSVRRCLTSVFDDYRKPLITQVTDNDYHKIDLLLEFCEDGLSAFKQPQEFITLLKSFDSRIQVDLTLTTRLF